MLELRPSCECCGVATPPQAEVWICTYECTWCDDCGTTCLQRWCPNCGGRLERRPVRPPLALAADPAATTGPGPRDFHDGPYRPVVCAGCGTERQSLKHHPRALCEDCVSRATAEDGEPLTFDNPTTDGGFVARGADGQERTDVTREHVVLVGDLRCWADEARLGGIVLEPYDDHHWAAWTR